ncbi:MAG: hypothetical protein HYZ22_08895 [Chloroflexi bacterium]|nr:hypothetical protein [Chloroflexota bacterium]
MRTARSCSILFTFLIFVIGCSQPLQPFNPTGNPETESPPQAVPTNPILLPVPSGNPIEFQYEEVEPGGKIPFVARGYHANEPLQVKITRPDGTETEYSAYADAYGVLDGTVSVAQERSPGVYGVTITGQTSGYETNGWFTVVSPIEVEDDVEFPVCTPTPFFIGDLDEIDAPINEITDCTVPVTLATCSFVAGPGNAGTLIIHCLTKGTGPGTVTFIPQWTGEGQGNKAERRVNFTLVCN